MECDLSKFRRLTKKVFIICYKHKYWLPYKHCLKRYKFFLKSRTASGRNLLVRPWSCKSVRSSSITPPLMICPAYELFLSWSTAQQHLGGGVDVVLDIKWFRSLSGRGQGKHFLNDGRSSKTLFTVSQTSSPSIIEGRGELPEPIAWTFIGRILP